MFKLFSKKENESEELRTKILVKDIRSFAMTLDSMINLIKDYGNMTKRKNNKLKEINFIKCRDTILALPLSLCVSNYIINRDKRLKEKREKLMKQVEVFLRKEIEEVRKNAMQANAKSGNNNDPSKSTTTIPEATR